MDAALHEGVEAIAKTIGLTYDLKQVFYYPPVEFDKDCVAAVRRAAEHFGYSHRDIVSGAGHDACYLARVTPDLDDLHALRRRRQPQREPRTSNRNGRPPAPTC